MNEQEAGVQSVVATLLMRRKFHMETQTQYIVRYTCEVNPRANMISQSVKRVKRETLLRPARQWQQRKSRSGFKRGSSIRPGARAASQDASKQAQ